MAKGKYKEYLKNVIPAIIYSVVCGILTGGVIFSFKFIASKIEGWSRSVYLTAQTKPYLIAIIFVALILFAVLMAFIHKLAPETKGGGIPRSEGVLRGVLSFRPLRTFLGTFFGSLISFVAGVPVGTEGPSVLLGTSIGGFTGMIDKRQLAWRRYVMTGGAGAGFAVATGAYVSGILFALEEIHKRFTPMLVLTVAISVISAGCVNELLCQLTGVNPSLFSNLIIAKFKLSHVGYLILLGLIVGGTVALFDFLVKLYSVNKVKTKSKYGAFIKLVIIFIATGVLALTLPDAVYSGHHLIEELLFGNKTALLLALILLIRFILMLTVTDSNVTGGIFIPMLAIGALTGALVSKLLVILGLPQEYTQAVILLSTCAFIGGILRAPLTATVLFIEITGQFNNLIFVAIVIFIVTLITEVLNQKALYDRKLESMQEEQVAGKSPTISHFKMTVCAGAFVVGKSVRDIMWPTSSVVVSVKHLTGNVQDSANDGEKVLFAGDTIIIRAKYYDKVELTTMLKNLVGKDSIIEEYFPEKY